jgi:ATP-dependent protease HslVU (ClpYQ) peptidase subunit
MKFNFIKTGLLLAVAYTVPLSFAQAQIITTAAGNGTITGATNTGATNSIAIDTSGNMYVATGGLNTIRKITPGNVVSTFAGTGATGFSGDNGPANVATFRNVQDLFITNGNLYVADAGNRRIRKINLTTNVITTVAGDGTPAVTGTGIGAAVGVAVDGFGNIYVAGGATNVIRKITPANVYSTFAGTGTAGFSGDGAAANAATLNLPSDLFLAAGKLYIADTRNRRIRMVNLISNTISTVAGDGTTNITGNGIGGAAGVVADGSGSIFVATGGAGNAIRKISGSTYTTISGGNASGAFGGDNSSGTSGLLNAPVDMAFHDSTLYIADQRNRRIRGLTLTTVPLALDLLQFTATPLRNQVLLQWSVVEKNVDAFEIERSNDAISFEKTGVQKSKSGQVATQANYSFTDVQPLNGRSFYRLKMLDNDGSIKYSNVVSVTFSGNGNAVISPVPAKDNITLSVSEHLYSSAACITDIQGKQVLRFTVSGNQNINVSGLSAGMYYLKLVDGTMLKFIKE